MFEPAHSLECGASLRRQPSRGSVIPESVSALLPAFALRLGRIGQME